MSSPRDRSPQFLRRVQNRPALRRRSNLAVFLQLFLVALGIAVGGAIAWLGNEYIEHNQIFRLRQFELAAVPANLRPTVTEVLAPAREANLLTMDLGWVHRQVGRIPEVSAVRVRRVLPDSIHVAVDVREPFVRLRTPGWTRPASRDGVVLSGAGRELPLILLTEPVAVGADRRLPDRIMPLYEQATAVIEGLPGTNVRLFRRLEHVRIDERGIVLVLRAPEVHVLLGDAGQFEDRLEGMAAAVGTAEPGTLVDLRFDSMVVTRPIPGESEE